MIPEDVLQLVSASYSVQAAEELREFVPSGDEFEALKQAVHETLLAFEPIPGACVLLTVLLQCRLESLTTAPSYVVAGTLRVKDELVFGTDDAKVDAATFS
jgi:hypothetical protein